MTVADTPAPCDTGRLWADLGGDAVSFAATGAALVLVAALNLRVRRSRPPRPSSRPQGAML